MRPQFLYSPPHGSHWETKIIDTVWFLLMLCNKDLKIADAPWWNAFMIYSCGAAHATISRKFDLMTVLTVRTSISDWYLYLLFSIAAKESSAFWRPLQVSPFHRIFGWRRSMRASAFQPRRQRTGAQGNDLNICAHKIRLHYFREIPEQLTPLDAETILQKKASVFHKTQSWCSPLETI